MEGDYYEMTPDAGKQYLVLSIDVTNTGADGVGLDVLSVSPKFTVVLNQSVKSTGGDHIAGYGFFHLSGYDSCGREHPLGTYSRCRMMWRRQTV